MPQCKQCRALAYRKSKYPSCASCLVNRRLDPNGSCAKCNARSGLRACRKCRDLLPIELCFYPNKARCKECLRQDKERRRSLSRAFLPASKVRR